MTTIFDIASPEELKKVFGEDSIITIKDVEIHAIAIEIAKEMGYPLYDYADIGKSHYSYLKEKYGDNEDWNNAQLAWLYYFRNDDDNAKAHLKKIKNGEYRFNNSMMMYEHDTRKGG